MEKGWNQDGKPSQNLPLLWKGGDGLQGPFIRGPIEPSLAAKEAHAPSTLEGVNGWARCGP